MPDNSSGSLQTRASAKGRGSRGRIIRLAYRGRGGTRWTFSPTVIRSHAGSIEVSMLVPLRVGLPVEIEQPLRPRAAGSAAAPPAIRGRVADCRCNADGLFRIRLRFHEV
jgi:hypothetical protein